MTPTASRARRRSARPHFIRHRLSEASAPGELPASPPRFPPAEGTAPAERTAEAAAEAEGADLTAAMRSLRWRRKQARKFRLSLQMSLFSMSEYDFCSVFV